MNDNLSKYINLVWFSLGSNLVLVKKGDILWDSHKIKNLKTNQKPLKLVVRIVPRGRILVSF